MSFRIQGAIQLSYRSCRDPMFSYSGCFGAALYAKCPEIHCRVSEYCQGLLVATGAFDAGTMLDCAMAGIGCRYIADS